ncbi:hypothetical protein TGME49_273400 [Toxoplasma gondii ME49]|uniref:Saposin B-type domain-containing protein n=1 Tax=Toxoplasma gondii (strain ATCC 50611 / Me49) TaxID=508771 RepID=S8EYX1_TOXGM|nr:hypothetical protein TGME49_273400 [Toxoplasma gondii ME49]EPT28651.1 hypothetical protein TGME49_273400 [Toxoplasma gondii ME49]|eukprot:XP_002365942.1 hypothetical protein TGME49_273400 [Toxoplasma gondii ME49]
MSLASFLLPVLLPLPLLFSPRSQAQVTSGGEMESMLFCTVCNTVVGSLNDDLKYLIDANKYWRQADLDQRLALACGHPQISKGEMKAVCGRFVMEHFRKLKHELYRRYTPGYEEHEELIAVRDFCESLKACRPQQLTLYEHYTRAAKKMVGEYEDKQSPYLAYQHKKMKERLLM